MTHTPLSAEALEAVARLARLTVEPGEMEDLRTRLAAVLTHAQALAALDLEGLAPLTHVGQISNRFAVAEPGALLDTETALSLAADRFEGFYRVPKVLGDGGGA